MGSFAYFVRAIIIFVSSWLIRIRSGAADKLFPIKFTKTVKKMAFEKLSQHEEEIGKAIVNAVFKVHTELGPGLLERVYEACTVHELRKAGFAVARQVDVPIQYDGITFEEGLRLDILIENKVIVEVKAVDLVNPVWQAQVLSHLKLMRLRLGYLINFNVPLIKEGIKRFIL